jgi:RNA polymerase sigma factor (sigma-70 family)
MKAQTLNCETDSDLIERACRHDRAAFEQIVSKYQNLLCSVAYSRCGDFATSEDAAQEAFCIAWRSLDTLREPDKLAAWLCGIVRHIAADAARRQHSRRELEAGEELNDLSSASSDPAANAVSREEEALVWESLEEIPETYREPLVLFYRHDHSVAEVAVALELTEEAVRQRLSRGRTMLRERVASVVEGTLRRSRPTRAFTMAVMAGLSASAAGKSALAGGGSAAASTALATAAKSTLPGLLGAAAGSLIGVFGGSLGLAAPAQLAPTRRERDFLMRAALRTAVVSCLLGGLMLIAALRRSGFTNIAWTTFVVSWVIALNLYIFAEVIRGIRRVKKIRQETTPDADPNPSPVKRLAAQIQNRYEPRHYRSSTELFGIPLLHINALPSPESDQGRISWTTGWLAMGQRARGFIAIGGLSQGIISIGGGSVGLISIGGIACGAVCLSGAALGVLAAGGLSIGWQAFGGLAFGWDLAVGGAAIAWHSAFGGLSIAHDYAVGGSVRAAHANDEIARQMLASEPLVQLAHWLPQHQGLMTVGCLTVLFAFLSVFIYATQRRKRNPQS